MPHTKGSPISNNPELLATISHEIRNPLNAIIGISRLLKLPSSEEEREKYIEGLLETSEHLLDLVDNIMDFSKINSDQFVLSYEPTDLRKAVRQNLASQKAIAEVKNLDFSLEIDESLPTFLIVDPVKLNQVILNLVSNAIKFTSDGGVSLEIDVQELRDQEVQVKFKIKDTGIGIPPENLQNILKPFHQGHYKTSMDYGGTGLGLSISKEIVDKMGGELVVKSELNKGSEFSFSINMDIDSRSEKPSSGSSQVRNLSFEKNLKILIVDDSELNVLVVQKNLEFSGFDFQIAHDGLSAVKMVQKGNFDLILMDLHMPTMDGIEATELIRNLPEPKYKELPIIGLTASTEKFFLERINSAGFTDLVTKPFRTEDLFKKIIEHTRSHQFSE